MIECVDCGKKEIVMYVVGRRSICRVCYHIFLYNESKKSKIKLTMWDL